VADTKISGLPAVTSVLGADEFPVNEAGVSKKATVTQLQAFHFTAGVYAPGSFTVATGSFAMMVKELILTGSQRLTMNGTARLRID
jgi:hypothetical protein